MTTPVLDYKDIEAELALFEAKERQRLGLEAAPVKQWRDLNPQTFTRSQRATTTLLHGGLTVAQDIFIGAALRGIGYRFETLPTPDLEALRFGKEFGNRGQCNPTYFTVGNLVKHLAGLRDSGMKSDEIVERYAFVTAGACGPCRFGTYATEYRKALRDAGFDGFRVLLFQQQGGLKQATGDALGLDLDARFFKGLLLAILLGDVLNAVGYRLRPYETNQGDTDRAMERSKALFVDALENRKSVLKAIWRCRRILRSVPVNRLKPRPKVSIIGEFWAMTTEGDGNYQLQRFLEAEGAEVDIQLTTAWLLYMIWQVRFDTRQRMTLRREDEGKMGLAGKNARKRLLVLNLSEKLLRGVFWSVSRLMGLGNYKLPDMDEIATISHQYYDNHLRGGEGHMEVGKLIQTVTKKKAHMVVSVKPFGCMPSSGVSDGIQSLITAKYPEAIFCAVETTGDGAVNVQSRIQMDLFKARQKAEAEYREVLSASGWDQAAAEKRLASSRMSRSLHYPARNGITAGTGAAQLLELKRG
jgi:predicted nucleotide-binding protein (sugar kinase/HSP70/actin superfamily)